MSDVKESRRVDLQKLASSGVTHAGLWLDRYLPNQDKGDTKATHFVEVAKIANHAAESTEYKQFLKRWRDNLTEAGAVLYEATVNGRMVVGLGNESVLETSVTLHRTYGVPYIPGSALKGLAATFAHQRLGGEWAKGKSLHNELFGSTDLSGCVTFYDALYKPGSGVKDKNDKPCVLWRDVMTVHHPDYYQGDKPPADWDSPNIIPFLSATGSYIVAISSISGDVVWAKAAHTILCNALNHLGIGAKTSSGYGRMTLGESKTK